jgi:hypothetical protein
MRVVVVVVHIKALLALAALVEVALVQVFRRPLRQLREQQIVVEVEVEAMRAAAQRRLAALAL